MAYNYYNPSGVPVNAYGVVPGTQLNTFPTAPRYEIIQVNGRNGAEAFQLAPNSRVLLLDETAPIIWLKTTDGAGYPTLTPYSISPVQTQEQKDTNRIDALEKRLAELEVLINEKSTSRSSKPKQTSGTDSTD